jgi:hypothetical protein
VKEAEGEGDCVSAAKVLARNAPLPTAWPRAAGGDGERRLLTGPALAFSKQGPAPASIKRRKGLEVGSGAG